MKKILVGSNAFFKDIKDFKSKDKDYLIFIDNPEDFKIRKEICLLKKHISFISQQEKIKKKKNKGQKRESQ